MTTCCRTCCARSGCPAPCSSASCRRAPGRRMRRPRSRSWPDPPPTRSRFISSSRGRCWLKMEGREVGLTAGDIVAFPFGTGHQLGAGSGGRLVTPTRDLPPKPWREIPVLRYGDEPERVRLLCGYLQCDALDFRPLRNALPPLLHVGTRGGRGRRLAARDDRPDRERSGQAARRRASHPGAADRNHLHRAASAPDRRRKARVGRLARGSGRSVARALHRDDPRGSPARVVAAGACGRRPASPAAPWRSASRAVLDTSPMRYVRDWRLYLASVALSTSDQGIAAIADRAGYGSEAAFNRAFSRAYGTPPAAWRQRHRGDRAA